MGTSRKRSLEQRLFGGGPKRLLSIDGGAMRVALALGILAEIEKRLIRRSGRANLRLSEYFDMIGGSSTGAVVAAGLAVGKTCEEIAQWLWTPAPLFTENSGETLSAARFDQEALQLRLRALLGDVELGAPAVLTGLAIFLAPPGGREPAALVNNARSPRWAGSATEPFPLRRALLRRIVGASLGGPQATTPASLTIGPDGPALTGSTGSYLDAWAAGVGNPALKLFHLVTSDGGGFRWPRGHDQLLLMSVGTGDWDTAQDRKPSKEAPTLDLVRSAVRQAVWVLEGLSRSPHPTQGAGRTMLTPFSLLSFSRLDARLEDQAFKALGRDLAEDAIAALRGAGTKETQESLFMIGQAVATQILAREKESTMLPGRFNPAFFGEKPHGAPTNRLDAMERIFRRRLGPND
jgi:hypothetical protein